MLVLLTRPGDKNVLLVVGRVGPNPQCVISLDFCTWNAAGRPHCVQGGANAEWRASQAAGHQDGHVFAYASMLCWSVIDFVEL
eukprot:scaffold77344_cov65-Phaeocystis_antarctica.AAC.2